MNKEYEYAIEAVQRIIEINAEYEVYPERKAELQRAIDILQGKVIAEGILRECTGDYGMTYYFDGKYNHTLEEIPELLEEIISKHKNENARLILQIDK